jgi:hypothetical protein
MEVWCAGVTARCAPTVLPALLILGLVPVTACRDSVPADEPVAREDPSPSVVLTEVTLYFTDTEELQVADCGAVLAARTARWPIICWGSRCATGRPSSTSLRAPWRT